MGDMASYACIAIGINRYQFLPPLSYGQADAQALAHFLVCQADLPSDRCLLLTDTSPLVGDRSTYPSRENIECWLEANRQNPGDSTKWRWFFFSGYGVSWERVDYLMPIDGNPNDIPGTGIPLRSLFASLKAQDSDNILVLLDINRSPGLQAGTPVGAETVELARQMGIALVLSSELDQFYHEAAALGNGLFTAALLETLRYYHTDTTLEKLDRYLRDRLPELSQHHWRPIQKPVTVIPTDAAKQQLILPTVENLREKIAASTPVASTAKTRRNAESIHVENSSNGTVTPLQKTAVSAVETRSQRSSIPTAALNRTTSRPAAMIPYPNRHSDLDTAQTPWWQQLLLWGGGAVFVLMLMIAAVVLRNREAFISKQPTQKSTVSPAPLPNTKAPPTASLDRSTKQKAESPSTSRSSRLKTNQAALEQAKRLLRPNQASLFNQAIVQTRSVKSGDPLYQQARQDITRWSKVILDIAEGRAEKGNFKAAIAAAQLVPKDDSSVYAKAQQTIEQWKVLSLQQQRNQGIIQAAKKQIQANQATSYSRAIASLRQITSNQPGYAEAQQAIAQWSRTIYLIAQSRASRGQFQAAIQAAALVPAGTPSSDAAKKAIGKWQQAKR